MKIIVLSTKANRKIKKLDSKVLFIFRKRVDIFRTNEFDQTLNNHKLQGEYKDCRSINITNDIRLIYEKFSENIYHVLDIGTHSELYS